LNEKCLIKIILSGGSAGKRVDELFPQFNELINRKVIFSQKVEGKNRLVSSK